MCFCLLALSLTLARRLGILLKVGEDCLRTVNDVDGQAGQSGDLDSVTFVRCASYDFAQEDDLVVPLPHRHIVVLNACPVLRQHRKLVVMGGEKRARPNLIIKMFGNAPGDLQAIKSRCTTANFIKDYEAAITGIVHDEGSLIHLHHESRLAAGDVITGSNARENAIDDADLCC